MLTNPGLCPVYQAEPRELSLKNIERLALFRMTDAVRPDSQKHLTESSHDEGVRAFTSLSALRLSLFPSLPLRLTLPLPFLFPSFFLSSFFSRVLAILLQVSS